MLQGHVSSKDAHAMMMLMVMPCYDHAQMMLKCKANTWGVTPIAHRKADKKR
jgi:hypothetical protein